MSNKNNTKKNKDITEWFNYDKNSIEIEDCKEIYDMTYTNPGCKEMHYSAILANGETLSLERV